MSMSMPITIIIGAADNGQLQRWIRAIKVAGWDDLDLLSAADIPTLKHLISEHIDRHAPFMVVTSPYLLAGTYRRPVFDTALGDLITYTDHYRETRPIIVVDEVGTIFDWSLLEQRGAYAIIRDDNRYEQLTATVRTFLDGSLFYDYLDQGFAISTWGDAQHLYRHLLEVVKHLTAQTRHMDVMSTTQHESICQHWQTLERFSGEQAHLLLRHVLSGSDAPAVAAIAAEAATSNMMLRSFLLSLSFLRQQLMIACWRQRALSNQHFFGDAASIFLQSPADIQLARHNAQAWQDMDVHKNIAGAIKGYLAMSKKFTRDMSRHSAKRARRHALRFDQLGDVTLFHTLSLDFGPNNLEIDHDPAWSLLATDIDRLFRFHARDAKRRELAAQRKIGKTLQASFWKMLRALAGYGFYPQRLLGWAGGILAFFTAAYAVNDWVGACNLVKNPVIFILNHIYIALTSFTGLGAAPTTCGPLSELLLGSETLIGFFLLSILAAVVIEVLQDR